MTRITVEKVKEGEWYPRTWFYSWVDGECIGQYKTKKEALEKATACVKARDELLRDLDEQLKQEFFGQ